MSKASQQFAAISYVAVLGAGVIAFMAYAASLASDTLGSAGWVTAGFLSLRETISKIENISLGMRLDRPDDSPSGSSDDPIVVEGAPPGSEPVTVQGEGRPDAG